MSHPVIVVLAVLLALIGAGIAYILVRGFRAGRFSRRFTSLDTALRARAFRQSPVPGGYEPGYSYRDQDRFGFWGEAAVRVLAVLICVLVSTAFLMSP